VKVILKNVIKSNEENSEDLDVEDDIIYIETVKVTNTNYVNYGASNSHSNEYLKAI